jgi:hypothetical protein
MPEIRPGQVHYVTAATKAVSHGAPAIEDNFCGVAIKQQAAPAGTGLGATAITQVAVGEPFIIQHKGQVLVVNSRQEGGTFAKGAAVYIRTADNLLTAVTTGNVRFGRVEAIATERGIPAGQMRVDLDSKV